MRRRSPVRRVVGLLALTLLLAAQPQVLCGLHCLLTRHAAHAGAPAGAPAGRGQGAPMSMARCHGGALTAHRTLSDGSVSIAWLPASPSPMPALSSRTFGADPFATAARSTRPDRASPPPRG